MDGVIIGLGTKKNNNNIWMYIKIFFCLNRFVSLLSNYPLRHF